MNVGILGILGIFVLNFGILSLQCSLLTASYQII
jgi:hypothetical protein